jgi:glutaminyl-peptide cyclotransferase
MDKKAVAAILLVVVVVVSAVVLLFFSNQGQPPNSPTIYTYSVINTYPHETAAFTEGLIFNNGTLYESTGEYGTSTLRRVDLQSGNVLQQYNLPNNLYGEGLAAVNGSLVQLTWQNKVGFVYDTKTFELRGNFSYATQGWGLTYDGNKLIMSDGTSNLYFLDATSHQVAWQVTVKDGDRSVTNINELEYVNGDVYANIWHTTQVAIINPSSGQVKGWIDLSGLHQPLGADDVLNGIAYDQNSGRLFVTGKDWPNLYQIELVPKS